LNETEIDRVHQRLRAVGFSDETIARMSEDELALYAKAILKEPNHPE